MTKINISSPGGGGTTDPAGNDREVQFNDAGSFGASSDLVFTTTGLGIKATPSKSLSVESSEQCVALFETDTSGAGIAFIDSTTTDADAVGVGAFGDLLCLRGGSSSVGSMQVAGSYIDLLSNELRNFIPRIQTQGADITVDNTNDTQYNGAVMELTGAFTITIANTVVDGFSLSVIQMDANQGTFAASGGSLTLRNRQGHTQTAGQWATTTIYKNGNNLVLAGDTA